MLFDAERLLSSDWGRCLSDRFDESFWRGLSGRLEEEGGPVFPSAEDVFRAFELTPLVETRVVIIGQDPYHGPGQADGLCFSVRSGPPFPPSLASILKRLNADKGCPVPSTGSLAAWARQGVLMLNVVLTVRETVADSHAQLGWESFTDEVIQCLRQKRDPVFILWGCKAHGKQRVLAPHSRVVRSTHPSGQSAFRSCKHAPAFIESRPFSQTNALLREAGEPEIDWCLAP